MSSGMVDSGQREIGESFVVGPLGVGCSRMGRGTTAAVIEVLETAAELGMTLLDTADVYGTEGAHDEAGSSEVLLGKAFREMPALRDRFVVATKGGLVPGLPYDSSSRHLRSACENSLRRLGVERIDLYQIHRPDPMTHPGEVADAIAVLHEEGKIGEVGVSNYTAAQLSALQAHLPLEIVTIQPEYSAARVDALFDGTFDQALELGLLPLAWSPLAGGRIISGDGIRPELLTVLDDLAQREEVSRAVIAIAFVLAHPSSPVALLGTQQPERMRALAAAVNVDLQRRDLYSILEASQGIPLP